VFGAVEFAPLLFLVHLTTLSGAEIHTVERLVSAEDMGPQRAEVDGQDLI
jgi:hypothetical protein